jgi:hypothetical protein
VTLRRQLAVLAAAVCALALPPVAAAGAPRALEFQTVPRLPGATIALGGRTGVADDDGVVRIVGATVGRGARPVVVRNRARGVRALFSRWYGNPAHPGRTLRAGFDLYYRVRTSFVDMAGRPIALRRVSALTLRNDIGLVRTIRRPELARPIWLHGSRVVWSLGPRRRDIVYVVDAVRAGGSNVVNRGQQRFLPSRQRSVRLHVRFYPLHFESRDLLFGFPIGSEIVLTFPNGHTERHRLGPRASLTLPPLPRGEYRVQVVGARGMSFLVPVALSRTQEVPLRVISYLDAALVLGFLLALALTLLLVRRPALRASLRPRVPRLPRVLPVPREERP